MSKDFQKESYIVDEQLVDTLIWLCHHQDCYERFEYDAVAEQLTVFHANGADVIRKGDYLTAQYGILITAHNFAG
ncbi:hypothetical protein [Acinetobacter sp. ANC 4173]|uniref:hypothetical protein n=1 Tax=Acinetobacter sp. ANC 4173 TaxID=2529837 RepID=UPI00103FDAE8|nr:hypothetical protein [Acinetobacter sp. ANC 4173]TCB81592.1 hypothetical protein E0H94_03455 [Acinetobacter sp. ANC 4173]